MNIGNRAQTVLRLCFYLPIAVSLLCVVLFETDVLPAGFDAGNTMITVFAAGMMELLTICLIPVALRLFKWTAVSARIAAGGERALLRWSLLRVSMLTVPLLVNLYFYYATLTPSFGYMCIIGLLAMTFVCPSRRRWEEESQ